MKARFQRYDELNANIQMKQRAYFATAISNEHFAINTTSELLTE